MATQMFSVQAILHQLPPMLAFFHDAPSSLRSAKVVSRFIAAATTMLLVARCKIFAKCFKAAFAIAAVYGMAKLFFNAICAVVIPSVR